jgi:hypothetical protein
VEEEQGRKRHIAVDTVGLLLAVVVTSAHIQDRDGAHRLLVALRVRFSTVSHIWADGGYTGRLLIWARKILSLTVEIVKRTDDLTGSRSCPAAGSSSAPSGGSTSTAAVSVTTRPCPNTTKPWST